MIPIGDTRRRFGFPWMTVMLLVLCAVFFLYERRVPLDQSALSVRPWLLLAGQHLALLRAALTSMLVQGPGWLEPLVNLVYLWVLGSKVEDACGPWGLLCITLLSAVSGVAVRLAAYPQREDPIYGLVGVIAGLFGAYIALYAFRPILAWLPPIVARLTPVSVVVHLLYWAGWEFVNIDFRSINLRNLQSGLKAISFEATWPMVGALIAGLAMGQLFARREYLWLQVLQARKALARR
jgi:membrane associated rhomboid family serine protease